MLDIDVWSYIVPYFYCLLEADGKENIIIPPVEEKKEVKQISTFRRVFPQFLACSANNMILFDNGLVLSFPTIVIAALLDNTTPGDLHFNSSESSWFASISYLCQPLGSLFSGMVMGTLGRKQSMLLLNIPFFTAWTLMYFSSSVYMLYIAGAISGFSVGCTEAPILTYVGEISEPRFRGMLTSYAQLCGSFAYFVVYLVGTMTSWRITAAFCAIVPIATALAVSLVPETPLWLISRGRLGDAEKALRWLRGWVPPENVQDEMNHLMEYHKNMTTGLAVKTSDKSESREILVSAADMSVKQKFFHFLRPQMRQPLFLVIAYFFFFYGSGLQTFRPYMIPVFNQLQLSIDTEEATVLVALIGVGGYGACVIFVSYLGKRVLTIISLIGCALCTFALSGVAHGILSSAWSFPVLMIYSFMTSAGVAPIPWMLQSEIYPFQGKGLAAAVAAAVSYVIGFIATKSYLSVESVLQLSGMMLLFTVISLVGAVYLFFRLPETEGRSFEEIEAEFERRRKK